jgi:hypothetical protein
MFSCTPVLQVRIASWDSEPDTESNRRGVLGSSPSRRKRLALACDSPFLTLKGKQMKDKAKIVFLALACMNAVGFFVGIVDTTTSRNSGHYDHNFRGGLDWVNDGHNGCVYKSYFSFTNFGYVAACELLRKRFEYEGIDKAFK